MAEPTRPPATRAVLATYRLQLRDGMDFEAGRRLLPYLADLGISHVYLSPILAASDGSTHGYDVVDPTVVDPALGGDAGFRAFVAAARSHRLGVVVDIVPNHLAADPERNRWWREVLQIGRASPRSETFDITWNPPDRKLRDQVLLPVLADHYGRVLDRGELRLVRAGDDIQLELDGTSYPVDPTTLAGVLQRAAGRSDSSLLAVVARTLELMAGTGGPAPANGADPGDRELLRRSLIEAAERPEVAAAIDEALAEVSADPAALHEVIDRQHYRLARWRTASEEVDYRRFFDITGLVGVRVELPAVFRDTHAAVAEWIEEDLVDGLRVDHPDGLADPAGYAASLRTLAGDRWIVVEKILEPGESLPPWPVDGTTGYDFLALVTGWLVEPSGYRRLVAGEPFADVVRQGKLDALHRELATELRRLTDAFVALCEAHPWYRDFTRRELHDALAITLACFPVYRTYVTAAGPAGGADRRSIERATATALDQRADIDPELLAMLRRVLAADPPFGDDVAAADLRRRFQQLSGAVMAKGKEDTALYRAPGLLAVNEVGCDPAAPATSNDDLHAGFAHTADRWPAAMLTLATHDTKRSDDVRARLAVLSELPDEWRSAVERWRRRLDAVWGDEPPDLAMEELAFQTLVGAHPLSPDRAWTTIEKSAREAGTRTSWLHQDAAYEAALRTWFDALMADDEVSADVAAFVERELRADGWANALSQRLLLLTAPGVPDLYQGSELWNLALVDPDNRGPVDFDRRIELLAQVTSEARIGEPGRSPIDDDGAVKLAVTHRALRLRRQHPSAFGPGSTYEPLVGHGPAHDHVVAFARGGARDDVIVTVVSRWHRTRRRVHDGWAGTTLTLPTGTYANVLTSSGPHTGVVGVDTLLGELPVALLTRLGEPAPASGRAT
jgi:(1->4)-alpha-D-glucan 1-alpha-D-glucosylmutase